MMRTQKTGLIRFSNMNVNDLIYLQDENDFCVVMTSKVTSLYSPLMYVLANTPLIDYDSRDVDFEILDFTFEILGKHKKGQLVMLNSTLLCDKMKNREISTEELLSNILTTTANKDINNIIFSIESWELLVNKSGDKLVDILHKTLSNFRTKFDSIQFSVMNPYYSQYIAGEIF